MPHLSPLMWLCLFILVWASLFLVFLSFEISNPSNNA